VEAAFEPKGAVSRDCCMGRLTADDQPRLALWRIDLEKHVRPKEKELHGGSGHDNAVELSSAASLYELERERPRGIFLFARFHAAVHTRTTMLFVKGDVLRDPDGDCFASLAFAAE